MVRRNIKIIEEKVVNGDIKFAGTLIFTQEKVVVKGNINARDIDAWGEINVAGEIKAFSVKGKIKHGTFVKKEARG